MIALKATAALQGRGIDLSIVLAQDARYDAQRQLFLHGPSYRELVQRTRAERAA